MAFTRIALALLVFFFLSLPLGFLEVAFGVQNFRFWQWRAGFWAWCKVVWRFAFHSRFSFVFGALIFVISPPVFIFVVTVSFLSSIYLDYAAWVNWGYYLSSDAGEARRNFMDKRKGTVGSLFQDGSTLTLPETKPTYVKYVVPTDPLPGVVESEEE